MEVRRADHLWLALIYKLSALIWNRNFNLQAIVSFNIIFNCLKGLKDIMEKIKNDVLDLLVPMDEIEPEGNL